MKITKSHLRRIIKEEKSRLLREIGPGRPAAWVNPGRLQSPIELRGKIRDEEQRLAKRTAELFGWGVDLPSEDSVMDDPDRFADMLMNAMEDLEAVSLALDAYEKQDW